MLIIGHLFWSAAAEGLRCFIRSPSAAALQKASPAKQEAEQCAPILITQNIKSVSKSVLSALFGIAFDQGLLPRAGTDPIQNLKSIRLNSFFPEFHIPDDITLFHLDAWSGDDG